MDLLLFCISILSFFLYYIIVERLKITKITLITIGVLSTVFLIYYRLTAEYVISQNYDIEYKSDRTKVTIKTYIRKEGIMTNSTKYNEWTTFIKEEHDIDSMLSVEYQKAKIVKFKIEEDEK